MSKHNLDLLVEAARLLEPLLGKLVFCRRKYDREDGLHSKRPLLGVSEVNE